MTASYLAGYTATGIQVLDWVCIATVSESCVTNMKWLNYQSGTISSRFSGSLGLNADPEGRDYGIVTPEPVADSYVKKLKEADIIEDAVFATAFRGTADTDPSYVDFGFYDEAAMNDPNDLVWIDNAFYGSYNQYYWNNELTAFRLRAQNADDTSTPDLTNAKTFSVGTEAGVGIISTGLSCLVMPGDIISFLYTSQLALLTANGAEY